jgi:hypothetical protein
MLGLNKSRQGSRMSCGIIVGCDIQQQWMLPWWWKHYSKHNSFPVVFIDFGMSEEAQSWCKERGECLPLLDFPSDLSSEDTVSSTIKACWEERYGTGFWIRREAWFKKPFSLFQSPFSIGIWIDVDCRVNANLGSLFQCLHFGVEIAVIKDSCQDVSCLMPGEIHYNSGVIVFRKDAPILKQWIDISLKTQHFLPGDQETLSRAIHLFKPNLMELPAIYNWYRTYPPNKTAIIDHYCGGKGKIQLLKSFVPETPIESLLLSQSLQSIVK